MNKILIAVLAAISVSAYAEDPNYDTSSGIVTIPRVTVDNSSTFVNVELFLNPNGTWQILRAEPEANNPIFLSGVWSGTATSSFYPGCNAQIYGNLTQNGNELLGSGTLTGNCLVGGSGQVKGSINGNNITFGFAYTSNTVINFVGTISEDRRTLSGTYSWPGEFDRGNWTLTLQ